MKGRSPLCFLAHKTVARSYVRSLRRGQGRYRKPLEPPLLTSIKAGRGLLQAACHPVVAPKPGDGGGRVGGPRLAGEDGLAARTQAPRTLADLQRKGSAVMLLLMATCEEKHILVQINPYMTRNMHTQSFLVYVIIIFKHHASCGSFPDRGSHLDGLRREEDDERRGDADRRRGGAVVRLAAVLRPVVLRLRHDLDLGRANVIDAVLPGRDLLAVSVPLQVCWGVAAPRDAGYPLLAAHADARAFAVPVQNRR